MKKLICALLVLLLAVAGTAASLAEAGSAWVCPDCGSENAGNFCMECGAARPARIVCPDCGAVYPIDTDYRFCMECGAKLPDGAEDPAVALEVDPELGRFATPEEAALRYLEGLRAGDLEMMLSASDWETLESHRTLERVIGRMRSYTVAMTPSFPRDGGLLSAMNVAQMRANTAMLIRYALLNFIADGPEGKGTLREAATGTSVVVDPEGVDAFIGQFDVARLDSLATLGDVEFYGPEEITDLYLTDANRKNLESMRALYGADEVYDLCVVFSIGGEDYAFLPGFARYGDVWTMYSPGGLLANLLGVSSFSQGFMPLEALDALL